MFDMFIPTTETGKLWTKKKLKALAAELAKGLKTEDNLSQLSMMLKKLTVETTLNAELTDHLGYEKNASKSGLTFLIKKLIPYCIEYPIKILRLVRSEVIKFLTRI